MSIPDYQTLMLPLLKFASDEQEHSLREATDFLAKSFNLSIIDLEEVLPSGQQSIFLNRVGWAKTYLVKSKILVATKRGYFKITDRGKSLLSQNLTIINNRFLRQFPEFIEFQHKKNEKDSSVELITEIEISKTPEESLEIAYQTIRNSLASEIIDRVKSCSPYFFERLVVELLVKMGYGGTLQEASALVTRKGSDEGIDGIIKEDRLGLDIIYIQAKRWENVVGRPEIQKFVGALAGQQAKKGVFITTSNFTKDAKSFADKIENKIILIDGEQLAEFMIDYNVGVSNVTSYELKRIDSDYFSED